MAGQRISLAGLVCAMGVALAACASDHAAAPAADTQALSGSVLIEGVRTISFSNEAPVIVENARVLIDGGRIAYAGDGARALRADTIIDGQGLTLVPGLADMHVHVWDEAELGAYLAHGVTTVRNMSGMPFHLDLAARISRGDIAGPRLLTTGPILNSDGPNRQINHQIVEHAESASRAVRWQYEMGFRRLKVYSNLTPDAYDAILSEAAALSMTITGHTPEGFRHAGIPLERPFDIAFDDVLDDGFETIEHVESIVWHGLRATRDETKARALAGRIASAGVPVTPTLLAHHNLYRVALEGESVLRRPGTEWLNPFEQATEVPSHQRWLAAAPEPVGRDDEFYGRVAKIFDEEGVLLVAGSDAGIFTNIPGLSLIEELELLVQAGISPYDALRSATYTPALVLKEPDRGCLSVGCVADLVLYACDPLSDIACARQPHTVIRQGAALDGSDLKRLLEDAATPDIERTQANLFAGLAAQGTSFALQGESAD